MALPFSLLIPDWFTFLDADGAPLSLGTLHFFEAGSLTVAKSVYSDADGTSLGAVVDLNAAGQPSNGMAPTGVFIATEGYQVVLKDSNGATVHTQDQVESVAESFLNDLGEFLAQGQKSATSPYTCVSDDNFVSISGGTVLLQPVNDRTQQLVIQNTDTGGTTTITADGAETINNSGSSFTLQAASSSQKLPAITLYPYPAGGTWLIAATAFVTP